MRFVRCEYLPSEPIQCPQDVENLSHPLAVVDDFAPRKLNQRTHALRVFTKRMSWTSSPWPLDHVFGFKSCSSSTTAIQILNLSVSIIWSRSLVSDLASISMDNLTRRGQVFGREGQPEKSNNRTQLVPSWVRHIPSRVPSLDSDVLISKTGRSPIGSSSIRQQPRVSRRIEALVSRRRLPFAVMSASNPSKLTRSMSRAARPSRTEILFGLALLASQTRLCCGVQMFMPPCPRGHKGLSISTVRLPADECAVRLLSDCFRLEVIAIGTLCELLPHLSTRLVRHLRIPAIL